MSECVILSLPRTKCENVRVLSSRIRLLFGVSVETVPDAGTVPKDQGSSDSVMTAGNSASSPVSEITRLTLTMMEGGPDQLNKAKDYLLAACAEPSASVTRRVHYSPEVLQRLSRMREEAERDTGALVRFAEGAAVVSGSERGVAAAVRFLDARAQDMTAGGGEEGLSNIGTQSREVFRQGRHLESEDSSYDSDYEQTTEPSDLVEHPHDDVSRTVSDTLGAEFAEYVTTRPCETDAQRGLDSIVADPNYTGRVEFALKLGYTETQVQISLQKLGAHASQNELLAELIKLGASSISSARTTPPQYHALDDHPRLQQTNSSSEDAVLDEDDPSSQLRHVVIDGSNVAMSHGNKECFSCRGIKICVDWFRARGHSHITVFVPRWRKEVSRPDAPIQDQEILSQLEKERLLVFTPSRHVGGRRMVCYDDRYVLRLAADSEGVVVSNDNYRDLAAENPDFKRVVEDRLLMYSFVNDRFMPPDDPLGRHGPSLDQFLRKSNLSLRGQESLPPPCPYGKKCTYGNKCKYHHPERGNQPQKSVTERLAEQAKIPLQEVKSRGLKSRESSPGDKLKSAISSASAGNAKLKKQPLSRTKSLVPSSTLVESSFEKTNAVERTKSDNSSVRCEDKDSNLQQGDQNVLFQAMGGYGPIGTYSGGVPWSPAMPPHISLTSDGSHHPTVTSATWSTIPTTLPPNIPGSCAEMFLEPDSGGHLFVAKRLSDPDASQKAYGKQQQQQTTQHQVPEAANLHRKLQRQLTLNPSYDPRLVQLGGYVERTPHLLLSPQQEGYTMMQQQQDRTIVPRASSQENIQQQQQRFGTIGGIPHQPLNRLASDSRTLQIWNEGIGGPTTEHQTVTRIASAPDSHHRWPSSTRMQHLNSTSDTRLNLYPDGQQMALPSHQLRLAGNVSDIQTQRHWISQGHGLDPPRPMSPAALNFQWQDRGSPIGQPVRPSSVPPPNLHVMGQPQPRPVSPDIADNARYRLYFHLASIFPKEQVQAALDMYPQETNPQKICAAILSMFPKG